MQGTEILAATSDELIHWGQVAKTARQKLLTQKTLSMSLLELC